MTLGESESVFAEIESRPSDSCFMASVRQRMDAAARLTIIACAAFCFLAISVTEVFISLLGPVRLRVSLR